MLKSAVACPESEGTNDNHQCQAIDSGSVIGDIWLQIGTHHFHTTEFTLATEALEQVDRFGRENVGPFAHYMLAWIHLGRHQAQALEYFARVLDVSREPLIINESIEYSGRILANQHWEEEASANQTSVTSRCRSYISAHLNMAAMPRVILATVRVLFAEVRPDEANAVLDLAEAFPGRFDPAEVVRLREDILVRTP